MNFFDICVHSVKAKRFRAKLVSCKKSLFFKFEELERE